MKEKNNWIMVTKRLIRFEHLNAHKSLFGGVMASWIDEASAIYAMERMKTSRIVTIRIGELIFKEPVHLGNTLEFCSKSIKEGNTSLTVGVRVQNISQGEIPVSVCVAEVTFVSINENERPIPWKK